MLYDTSILTKTSSCMEKKFTEAHSSIQNMWAERSILSSCHERTWRNKKFSCVRQILIQLLLPIALKQDPIIITLPRAPCYLSQLLLLSSCAGVQVTAYTFCSHVWWHSPLALTWVWQGISCLVRCCPPPLPHNLTFFQSSTRVPWRGRQYVSPKYLYPPNRLNHIIMHKT